MPEKIGVTISPAQLTLMAGDTAEVIATLQNRGDTVDQLTLSIDGADPEWYSLPVSSVALFPNDKDDLKITFHIPKGDPLKAGAHRLKVNVASQENPSEGATAELTINIQEMFELQLAVSPEEVVGRKGTYQVVVANPGNATVTVYLKASDTQNRLRYQFGLEHLEVEGGSRAGTTLQVRLGWLAKLGGERAFDFHVAAMLPEEARKPSPDFCSYCGQKLRPDLSAQAQRRCQGGWCAFRSHAAYRGNAQNPYPVVHPKSRDQLFQRGHRGQAGVYPYLVSQTVPGGSTE